MEADESLEALSVRSTWPFAVVFFCLLTPLYVLAWRAHRDPLLANRAIRLRVVASVLLMTPLPMQNIVFVLPMFMMPWICLFASFGAPAAFPLRPRAHSRAGMALQCAYIYLTYNLFLRELALLDVTEARRARRGALEIHGPSSFSLHRRI